MIQPTPAYQAKLRQGIVNTFSAEELITLCSDLGVDYDNLPGQSKEARARELIAYLSRRQRLAPLVAYCKLHRPDHDWPPDLNGDEERASLMRQLDELRSNLRLIEERMSEYVELSQIPLQLVKDKRQTEARIAELEDRLTQP